MAGSPFKKQSCTQYVRVCERTVLLWEVNFNWLFLTKFKPEGFSNFKYLYEQEYCTISIKHSWTEDELKSLEKSSVSCLEVVYVRKKNPSLNDSTRAC